MPAVQIALRNLQEQQQELEKLLCHLGSSGVSGSVQQHQQQQQRFQLLMHGSRHLNVTASCADAAAHVCKWLQVISNVKDAHVTSAGALEELAVGGSEGGQVSRGGGQEVAEGAEGALSPFFCGAAGEEAAAGGQIAGDAPHSRVESRLASRLFMAGDNVASGGSAMVVPREFAAGLPALLARSQDIADQYDSDLLQCVEQEGWPPPGEDRVRVAGAFGCKGGCGGSYSRVWVEARASLCFVCVARLRDRGQCVGALSRRCVPASFCPHARRCYVCDAPDGWPGCPICRLERGDGEDVAALVSRVGAHAVFLDFDRTLCSTKRGGSPLANPSSSRSAAKGAPLRLGRSQDAASLAASASTHTLDESLHALASSHPNVHIVTRNSNVLDIQVFLRMHGLSLAIHSVPKSCGRSKADVILSLLPGASVGVFVDDCIAEHLDLRLVQCQRLHRLLFVRS